MCLLAELRRAIGDAKACVNLLFRGSLRQRLERLDVGVRPGRTQERRAEHIGSGDHELHRDSFHGDPDTAVGDGHDLR